MRLCLLALLAGAGSVARAHVDDSEWTSASRAASNASLVWGSWRPNLYIGFRARQPDSLLFGLLWFGVHDYASVQSPSRRSPRPCAETYVQR